MVRVLQVSPYFAPAFRYGGPPRSLLGLCTGLLECDVQVEVFTTTANGEDDLPEATQGFSQYFGVPVKYFPRTFPRRIFAARGLRNALGERLGQVDLVHLHGIWNAPVWLAARACAQKRVPYIVSLRGMLDAGSFAHHRYRKELMYRLWERRYLKLAAFLHVTSPDEERFVVRRRLGTVVRVPNGVARPESLTPSFRSRFQLADSVPVIAFVGRIHRTKRLDVLLSAFGIARQRLPDARLAIAGPEDGLSVRTLLGGTGLAGSVLVLGELDEAAKWALVSEADVLVLCSDSESFGLVVAEALAVGTPVVVTKNLPWDEVVEAGCGLSVEQDPVAIAAALVEILTRPDEARKMGERGRSLVENKYDWRAIATAFRSHYERIIDHS